MAIKDGREVYHKTPEEMRIREAQGVEDGKNPEAVISAPGYSRSCIYDWIAK